MDAIKHGVYYKLIKVFGHTFAVYGFCYKDIFMYFSVRTHTYIYIYMKPGSSFW